jgi:Tfp pilus assembly protein PilF
MIAPSRIGADNPKALSNRGITLQVLNRLEEALESYDRALAAWPEYPEALYNRGIVLHQLKRFEEALESYDRALAQRSDYAEALSNRGLVLHEVRRLGDALASFDGALALRPDFGEAHSHRGTTLHEMERFDEALASYDRAVNLRPDCAEAHYNLALCQPLTGDFERGWGEREWRWQTEQTGRWNFKQPVWRGSNDIAGKTILVHAEQGFGDMIQFCRYVPLVVERGARVILEVPEPLHQLMGSFGVLHRSYPGASRYPTSICIARCSVYGWQSSLGLTRYPLRHLISARLLGRFWTGTCDLARQVAQGSACAGRAAQSIGTIAIARLSLTLFYPFWISMRRS